MIYIGLDPGKNGGYAIISGESFVETSPYNEQAFVAQMNFISKSYSANEIRCCLEKVGAKPGQGVTSMFTFGTGYGFLQGVLTAFEIPYQLVPPHTWKKEFSLNSDKQTSIEVCQRLFPQVRLIRTDRCKKPHDGMAEALLMAEYARRKL